MPFWKKNKNQAAKLSCAIRSYSTLKQGEHEARAQQQVLEAQVEEINNDLKPIRKVFP